MNIVELFAVAVGALAGASLGVVLVGAWRRKHG